LNFLVSLSVICQFSINLNIFCPLIFKYFRTVIFQIFHDRYFSNILWPLIFKKNFWSLFFKYFMPVIFTFKSFFLTFYFTIFLRILNIWLQNYHFHPILTSQNIIIQRSHQTFTFKHHLTSNHQLLHQSHQIENISLSDSFISS
jgi:hypothetical protein